MSTSKLAPKPVSINTTRPVSPNTTSVCGQLYHHAVRTLGKVSSYIQYNQVTLATSILAVNLALIHLADRLMRVASTKFKLQCSQNPVANQSAPWLFKAVVALGGATIFNRLMNLHLTPLYITASTVSTLALYVLLQKIVAPALKNYLENPAPGKKSVNEGPKDVSTGTEEGHKLEGEDQKSTGSSDLTRNVENTKSAGDDDRDSSDADGLASRFVNGKAQGVNRLVPTPAPDQTKS